MILRIKKKRSLLENILQSHVDIVTLIALYRVSQQRYEDSIRQDLVNLLVVPNTIIVRANSEKVFHEKDKYETCGI